MKTSKRLRRTGIWVGVAMFLVADDAGAQKDVFEAPGDNHGVWQLTSDPTVRDWANYHNTQCFSPDGRYVCYTHWPSGSKGQTTVRLFDLHTDADREIGSGIAARWARHHNWLLYAFYNLKKRGPGNLGTETVLFDVDTGESKVIATGPGAEQLGETTFNDAWLIAAQRFRGQSPEFRIVRIKLPEGGMQSLPRVVGSQLLPNPRHPLFFARKDNKADPFKATRFWYDLDGGNQRIAVPTLQQCHMSWSGNGEYMLLGNGLICGRKWDEPFPSNVHILASVAVGDISPCGVSGRWVCGDSTVADLRSGDGRKTVEPLSQICYPAKIADNSGIYDADPKGSPDGTKVCFVSNYPLKGGPRTEIVEADRRVDRIVVQSTEGFPERGHLCVQREVISYQRKTETAFEGITRQAFDTASVNLRAGRVVTSYEARCLTDEQFESLDAPNVPLAKSIGDADSPLMRQRMTDVYVAVVRKPDRPFLRPGETGFELIPGENHNETFGYHLLRDSRRVTNEPIRPGSGIRLDRSGEYCAVAVEWSGLQSEPSLPVRIERIDDESKMTVLCEKPGGFSWTAERWADEAKTLRETVHQHDDVIRREWFADGVILRRHDLNHEGKAIRRVELQEGRVATREYHHRELGLVSREIFDGEGYITDWIRFQRVDGAPTERDHWHFERGMPVRHTYAKGREYVKQGDRWGYRQGGKFIDQPRE